jgi:quinoprotein glucose dehydrogenase
MNMIKKATNQGRRSSAVLTWLHAALILLLGTPMLWLGFQLLSAGGSPYYVCSGVALVLVALLIIRRDRRAALIYFGWLAITLAWSLWEVGLDGWALLARLGLPSALSLTLLWQLNRRAAIAIASVLTAAIAISWVIAAKGPVPPPVQMSSAIAPDPAANIDWPHYGNDAGGSRFSPLQQITAANIGALEPAWTYHIGRKATGSMALNLEVTPLKVGERLFICTGTSEIIALSAETGRELWRYDPKINPAGILYGTCRGVAYLRIAVPDATTETAGTCIERIFAATLDARLIALDAATGVPCAGFGRDGVVSLEQGMGDVRPGYYHPTSAPQVIRGRVVVGGWVTDGQYVGEPSGVVRAFDGISGKLSWAFDTGRAGDSTAPIGSTPYTPGPNSWAPMSADERLGLVYLPTGSATPDYVSAHRTPGDQRYATAVVAVDAETGSVRWSFQTVHNDVWDYDVASQPTLLDLPDGTPALVQPTKRGQLFLLDRRNGQPLADVVERSVPQSTVPGEKTSATQPFSIGMPDLSGEPLLEKQMWGLTPIDQAWCRLAYRKMRYDGSMQPPGLDRASLIVPGRGGGMNWGSVAYDPTRGLLIANTVQVGNSVRLIPRADPKASALKPLTPTSVEGAAGMAPQIGTPYAADVSQFLSPLYVPCRQPPWGLLTAIDVKTRRKVWSVPLGTGHDNGPLGLRSMMPFTMGVPNLGGSLVTAAGLTFIGATTDDYLRVFDTKTGRELRQFRLPAGGQATPMSYWSTSSARQFVVIAAGGNGGMGTRLGDTIIAYALPRSGENPNQ